MQLLKNISKNKNYFFSPLHYKLYKYHKILNKKGKIDKIKCENQFQNEEGDGNCYFCEEGLPLETFFIFDIIEFNNEGDLLKTDILILRKEELEKHKISLEEPFMFFTNLQFDEKILNVIKNKLSFENTKRIIKLLKNSEDGKKLVNSFYETLMDEISF